MPRLSSILAVLFPLVAASPPHFGPEVPVSAPRIVPADRAQLFSSFDLVSIASNGSMALAVWQEQRSANENDIFAARIDANGNLLDPLSIAVTATPAHEENPRVLWDGSNFVLFWSSEHSIVSATIDTAGRIVQPPAIVASAAVLGDVAISNGVIALVVRGAALSDFGTVTVLLLAPGSSLRSTTVGYQGLYPHLTATPFGFAVAWETQGASGQQIHAAQLFLNGAIALPDTVVMTWRASPLEQESITARGTDVFITASTTSLTIFRLQLDGTVETVSTTPFGSTGGFPSNLMADDSGFTVLMRHIEDLSLWRLSPAGTLIATHPLATKYPWQSKMVLLGGRPYILSSTAGSLNANVYGQFLDETSAHLISQAAENQQSPVLASDGARILAVWSVGRGSQHFATRGVMLAFDGRPLGNSFEVLPDHEFGDPVAAVFDGRDYVVVRVENVEPHATLFPHRTGDLVATHVSRDGVPRGDRLVFSTKARWRLMPSVASDGTNVLIAWIDDDSHAKYALLTPGGPAASVDLGTANTVAVAWNGTNYAMAIDAQHAVARISRDGALLGTTPIDSMPELAQPAIASDGDGFLIVYADNAGLQGLALDRNAQPAGAPHLLRPRQGSDLRLTWNGAAYDLAWTEATPWTDAPHWPDFHDAYGVRVRPDGTLASDVYAISVTPTDDSAPFPLGLGGGNTILAYSRMVAELEQSQRVFTRLSSPPHGRAVRR